MPLNTLGMQSGGSLAGTGGGFMDKLGGFLGPGGPMGAPAGSSGVGGLLSNPLFAGGMGLLGGGNDPIGGLMGGLASANKTGIEAEDKLRKEKLREMLTQYFKTQGGGVPLLGGAAGAGNQISGSADMGTALADQAGSRTEALVQGGGGMDPALRMMLSGGAGGMGGVNPFMLG
jgi:hypothetical protein